MCAHTSGLRARFFACAVITLVLLFAFALPLSPLAQSPGVWGAPVNISESDTDSWRPSILLDKAGNVHIVWYDQVLGSAEGDIRYASRSSIDGWSDPQRLSASGGESSRPVMAIGPDSTVHVVWQEGASGESEILYTCKPFKGAWTPVRNISRTDGDSTNPHIAASGDGQVHVIWQERAPGLRSNIYHTCQYSSNLWTSPCDLSQSDGDSTSAVILADAQGTVHVCWQDRSSGNWEIFHACQPSGGAWTAPQNISGSEGDSQGAAIALATSGALHLVWSESAVDGYQGDSHIFYTSRSPGGVWSPAIENLSGCSGRADFPVVAVDAQGDAHVAWQYVKPPGFWNVYATSSNSQGKWSEPGLVSTFDGNAERPAILAGQRVDLVWAGSVHGNWEICHAHGRSAGTWSPVANISHTADRSSYPALASDGAGALHVVWEDTTPGHRDIHYAGSSAYAVGLPFVCGSSFEP